MIIHSPEGTEAGLLRVPSGAGTLINVYVGGSGRKNLFVKAMSGGSARGVYKAEVAFPGYP